ncbi:MAG: outer membrane protein assembly factor BamA [Bacteroidetes bacterium QH_9_64_21]|nr:MAG: outer membrane protein assembly factor BamA [Bacteroidetes bacterium QH_9_64_21]
MRLRLPTLFLAFLLGSAMTAGAQTPTQSSPTSSTAASPRATYVIEDIRVEGVEDQQKRQFVEQSSGLARGQEITLPSGDAIAQAIRSVYDLRLFSDVSIHRTAQSGNKVTLTIKVTPEPTLASYELRGIDGGDREDLKKEMPLLKGSPVRPSDVERSKQVIKNFYEKEGYLRTEVDVERSVSDNRVNLAFNVDRREEIEVHRIRFSGNEEFDDGDLRGAMEETVENRWWRIWKGETFDRSLYEEDLERVIDHYREHGYYDAQVVQDSVYYMGDDGLGIDVEVREGSRYYVSDVNWEGNTVYDDRVLSEQLGLSEGDVYNGKALDENLYGGGRESGVLGLYMDRGYMRADVQPTVRVVGEDSLDITMDVREGEVYTFGDIDISGNTKTKDYVIRRELYTVPGNRFSRSSIQESIRRLNQLDYFSQESLSGGPDISVDEEEKEAELTYSVEEVGSDQLQLSGTFGQFGLVLQLGFQFNNFSAQNMFEADAWRPLPSGDGQKLSVNVRTNGSFYQNYSLSFTEPWFGGSPTPVGGSASYSKYTRSVFGSRRSGVQDGKFENASANLFVRQRLDWPDDKFMVGSRVGYQFYNNRGRDPDTGDRSPLFSTVPFGVSQSVTFRQSLSRNSVDNPTFPRTGSNVSLSVEVAPPFGDLVQYHKWRFETSWNVPIGDQFSFGAGTDFGYIGSITGEEVQFETFEVGGTPFDYQGGTFGTDPVYMRGYPRGVIGPLASVRGTNNLQPEGGQVLNKYTSEFRWKAVESQQLQARPYLFLDAANAWSSLDAYNPSELYRSAGVGVKLFLPIVGMIEFNYGYNFDEFVPLERGSDGQPGWTFQFSLGQGFGRGGGGGGRR